MDVTPGPLCARSLSAVCCCFCLQCELAADPETISAGLQLVSALQAVDPADAVFSTLCSPVLQRLAACDQPHPRVVRWALAWAAARLEGGTSAGSSSAAAEAALSIKTGQAGAAQQVPLSTEAVQQLMEELLDMVSNRQYRCHMMITVVLIMITACPLTYSVCPEHTAHVCECRTMHWASLSVKTGNMTSLAKQRVGGVSDAVN
jgi:hypothetical protein